MAKLVTSGCMMQCTGQFVPAPIPFTATPTPGVMVQGMMMDAGVQTDVAPGTNIPPTFGACKLDANPAVATAKAGGSPSAPCVYAPMGMWMPVSMTVKKGGMGLLTDKSKIRCATAVGAGEISFISTVAQTVEIGG